VKKQIFLIIMVTGLSLWLLQSIDFGQEVPPGPTVAYKSTLEVNQPPDQFEAIQVVLDFAPGTWTPLYSYGGQGLVTVLAGEITTRSEDVEHTDNGGKRFIPFDAIGVGHDKNGDEHTYKAGESWIEQPGAVHEAGNAGVAQARLVALFLLPPGSPLTPIQEKGRTKQLPPGPTVVSQTKLEVTQPPGPFDVIQLGLDFAPGTWTPLHSHGGQGLVTVVAGEITERRQGTEQIHKVGEGWIEQPDAVHEIGNTGAMPASLTVAYLLPKGAELTTVQRAVPPRTLPQTGEAEHAPKVWFLLLAGSGLIIGGWFSWRKISRSGKV
jgi:quercetin dioxygenase-like cupin family protein